MITLHLKSPYSVQPFPPFHRCVLTAKIYSQDDFFLQFFTQSNAWEVDCLNPLCLNFMVPWNAKENIGVHLVVLRIVQYINVLFCAGKLTSV